MLNPDSLVERSKLKSQVTLWRALTFIVIILTIFFVYLVDKKWEEKENKGKGPYIARVDVDGIIMEDQERVDIIDEIANNDDIKGVIVHINSPGGTAVGGEQLYGALKDLSAKKPVVAVMDSLAASAAYLISLGCGHVFTHQGTITGSIGVIMEIPNLHDSAEKLGVKVDYIRTSPIKGSPTLFEPKNEKAYQNLDNMMQDFYTYFVKVVAENRKLPLDEAYKLSDGRVFSGKAAVDNKLVDEIGGEKEAYQWLVNTQSVPKDIKVREVKLKKPKKPFEEFFGSISQNLGIKTLANQIFDFKGLMLY